MTKSNTQAYAATEFDARSALVEAHHEWLEAAIRFHDVELGDPERGLARRERSDAFDRVLEAVDALVAAAKAGL